VRVRFFALGAGLAVLAVACGASEAAPLFQPDPGAAADYSFVIPLGAGEAIDRGEPLDVLPAALVATVGEVIELVNHDDRGHLVGPFFVGAGETLRQRFSSPGEFIGTCTVHPSGEFELTVLASD
jgi:hypothetical protein